MLLRDYMHMRASEPYEVRQRNRENYEEYKQFIRAFSEKEDYDNEQKKEIENWNRLQARPGLVTTERRNQLLNAMRAHKARVADGEDETQGHINIMKNNANIDADEKLLKSYNKQLRQCKYKRKDRKKIINDMRTRLNDQRWKEGNEKDIAYLKSKGIKHFSESTYLFK